MNHNHTFILSPILPTGADGDVEWWVPTLAVLAVLVVAMLLAGLFVGRRIQARRKGRVEMVAFSNQLLSDTNRNEPSVVIGPQAAATITSFTNNTYSYN